MNKRVKKPGEDQCHHCNKIIKSMQGIGTEIKGKSVSLCPGCWNKLIATQMGLDFQTIELKPITLRDCEGKGHEFHFMTHMVPTGLAIEAREIFDDNRMGYEFSVLGSFDCNQADLILDLYEIIKKGLSKKYLKHHTGQRQFKDMTVVARITSDLNSEERMPMLVIDGKEVNWAEFGTMLTTFEGWQFKLDIFDRIVDFRKEE
jgi:hypothetical protein